MRDQKLKQAKEVKCVRCGSALHYTEECGITVLMAAKFKQPRKLTVSERAARDFKYQVCVLRFLSKQHKALQARASAAYVEAVQMLVDKHQVHLATGHMSDTWQVKIRNGQTWMSEDDEEPHHPIFDDLKVLDELAEKFGVGPTNLERYDPRS